MQYSDTNGRRKSWTKEMVSTMRQNRTTKQVRILAEIHKQLKYFALERNSTISKLVDQLLILGMEKMTEQTDTKRKKIPP